MALTPKQQAEVDKLIRKWKGNRAVEELIGAQYGNKWPRYQRWRLEDDSILHVNLDRMTITITDARLSRPKGGRKAAA